MLGTSQGNSSEQVCESDFTYVSDQIKAARDAQIAALIESVVSINQAGEVIIPEHTRRMLLTSGPTSELFHDTTLQSYHGWPIVIGLAMAVWVSGFMLSMMARWSLSYPHVGWKRLALIASPSLTCVILGLVSCFSRQPEAFQVSLVVIVPLTIGVATLTLLGRDAVCWINHGFGDPSKRS